MNALLSKELLKTIGIELDNATFDALSDHYESTLDSRITESIVDLLDENQLNEFQTLKGADRGEVAQWIAANVPELQAVIEDEVAILLGELAEQGDAFAA